MKAQVLPRSRQCQMQREPPCWGKPPESEPIPVPFVYALRWVFRQSGDHEK